ncbi:hypothetical protein M1M07_24635 [Rhodococcus sp. HM1]|uniref:hypothetical protein n=1 Tax=Rhodococcus sp. HM1 TaxID=2937759 RepID=UPI00200B6FCD|nr:hypothetical protein [Rhodococcus sp. HM1]MCK8674287.1 hypothetical protein [Rhodococcus sp. HM1]
MTKRQSVHILESAQFGDTTMPEYVIEPARRTVASHAHDAEDARQLLEMLGLIDPCIDPAGAAAPVKCQRRCEQCGRPMRNQGEDPGMWPGTVAIRAKGMCGPCYDRDLRARNAS